MNHVPNPGSCSLSPTPLSFHRLLSRKLFLAPLAIPAPHPVSSISGTFLNFCVLVYHVGLPRKGWWIVPPISQCFLCPAQSSPLSNLTQ